jgi:predicted ATPase
MVSKKIFKLLATAGEISFVMQIKSLEYYDHGYQWKLETLELLPNFNLLVGVSGVGKTRILEAIYNLRSIANGQSLNGVQWNACFIGDNNHEYTWKGEFETKEGDIFIDNSPEENEKVSLISESLVCHRDDLIIERQGSEITFNGSKTPRLSPFESVIDLLKQEDQIAPIKKSIDKIILSSNVDSRSWAVPLSILTKYEKSSLSVLQGSGLPLPIKLAILYKILPEEFNKIKEAFTAIFPTVLDVKIEPIKNDNIPIPLSNLSREVTTISIKEKGVQGWIDNISSGMLKTLMYISELYLAPDGCIILIDEFENSLGINCLDSITELVLSNKKLQFVMTSHHPYIINNISPAYWKIVTRQSGLVTVKNAQDFHISPSRQKAFIDLINVFENNEDLEG